MCHAEAKPSLRFAHGQRPFYALHYAPGLARHTQALVVIEKFMKHACPHCQRNTITSWSKFNSSSLHPAKCIECRGVSKQHYGGSFVEGIISAIGLPAVLIWSLCSKSWLPVIGLLLLVVVVSALKFIYVPMVVVDIDRAKKYHWFAFGALLVLTAWALYEGFGK